jgi:tRNA modification GTPase
MERAIVTDIPGTTRDTIEEWVEVGGFPVKLIDTAGITQTDDPVEKIGISRTKQALEEANLILVMLDGSSAFDERDQLILDELPPVTEKILCITKTDLDERIQLPQSIFKDDSILRISSLKNEGLDELEERILSFLEEGHISSESLLITNTRHADCLDRALNAITKTLASSEEGISSEFIVEDLKVALQAIGEVVGEVYTEDLLGVIFSRFCIGK